MIEEKYLRNKYGIRYWPDVNMFCFFTNEGITYTAETCVRLEQDGVWYDNIVKELHFIPYKEAINIHAASIHVLTKLMHQVKLCKNFMKRSDVDSLGPDLQKKKIHPDSDIQISEKERLEIVFNLKQE